MSPVKLDLSSFQVTLAIQLQENIQNWAHPNGCGNQKGQTL